MARPKNDGKGRLGGRKKGTPNKSTQALIEKAEAMGIDPFEVLILFAGNKWKQLGYKSDKAIPPSLRASCASDACQYIHAKRKAIEHSGKDGDHLPPVVVMMPSNGREKS